MLLSLISPQKNVAFFAADFKQNISWIVDHVGSVELIIVEDHSTDNSWGILKKLFSSFENVRVVRNEGFGKVEALNFGFSLSSGQYVRFIDGDDYLLDKALIAVKTLEEHGGDALSSSFKIKIDNQFHPVPSKFLRMNVFANTKFHSPPRWNWTLKKELAHEIFPIPQKLPFEDLYMAVKIVHQAIKIVATPQIDYIYVQHNAQTYGGIHKNSRELTIYRANRNLKVLEYLDSHLDLRPGVKQLLKEQQNILSGKRNFKRIVLTRPVFFALAFRAKLFLDLFYHNRYKKQSSKVYLND